MEYSKNKESSRCWLLFSSFNEFTDDDSSTSMPTGCKCCNKGLFTLDIQCALNRIESGLSAFTLNAHSPNPDPIQINPNPLPEVVSIRIELDHAIAPCAWGPKRAWHARSSTVSALLWATHCVPRICSTREAIWWLAEVKIWRGRHGSCVEVWSMCTREFGSAQCSVDANHAIDAHWFRIEFALDNSVTEPVWIQIQSLMFYFM